MYMTHNLYVLMCCLAIVNAELSKQSETTSVNSNPSSSTTTSAFRPASEILIRDREPPVPVVHSVEVVGPSNILTPQSITSDVIAPSTVGSTSSISSVASIQQQMKRYDLLRICIY